MTTWINRSIEERALLNPAFCAALIWNFASSTADNQRALSFAEAFLVLPIVLPRSSRDALPRSTRTSLASWLDENPSFQATLVARSRAMVPFTKEALIFGGTREFLHLSPDEIRANAAMKRRVNAAIRHSSNETQACYKRATFLGSWFIETGGANTVMALLGVRP